MENNYKQLLPLLYNFNLCCTEVMAPSTDSLLTLLLMFDAVPNSSANILDTRDIWSFGGMISDIMLVPFLEASKYKHLLKILWCLVFFQHCLNIDASQLQIAVAMVLVLILYMFCHYRHTSY